MQDDGEPLLQEEDLALFPGAEVWVENGPGHYHRGFVVESGGDEIVVDFGDRQEGCAREAVWPANEQGLYVEDLANLVHLSSATLIENMRAGLAESKIYSWVGPILLAVNPMRPLPSLYTENLMHHCRDAPRSERLAHPYMQAELALRELMRHGQSASFVVSGESGAGKTETTRQLLNYCLWRADHHQSAQLGSPIRGGGGRGGGSDLASTLLEAASVVELFGSAATVHNANSSRVGRFLELQLRPASGGGGGGGGGVAILGARLQTFLLERSRVVSVQPGERGFHVLYGLLASPLAVAIRLAPYGISAADFGYLRPGTASLDERNDGRDFDGLQAALRSVGLTDDDVRAIGCLLASVLLLGNVSFEQDEDGRASPTPAAEPLLAQLAEWLGADLSAALVSKQLQVGGMSFGRAVTSHLDAASAGRARDAVARALYANLFARVVALVNTVLAPFGAAGATTANANAATLAVATPAKAGGGGAGAGVGATTTVGLLDIFGFERFDVNSLEQLLINYANERLHAHFLACVFEAEGEAYAAEGVPFPPVSVPSNAELLSLVGEPPLGLLALLDDQSTLATPSDEAFTTAAVQAHARSTYFSRPKHRRKKGSPKKEEGTGHKPASHEFVLRHYAGSIKYVATGFVEKNTDKLPSDAQSLLVASSVPLVASLFAADATGGGGGGRGGGKRGAGTVSGAFSESLRELSRTLESSRSYFIRCVRPRGGVHRLDSKKSRSVHRQNSSKSSADLLAAMATAPLHGPVVLAQLEASGVLEAVSLMSLGYPSRIPYEAIHSQYGAHLPAWAQQLPPRELVNAIAVASEVPTGDVAYGATSLFCRAGKAAFLERLLGSDGDGLDEDGAMGPQLTALLEDFERRRKAMPILEKNLRMWIHRRRFLALREIRANEREKKRKATLMARSRLRRAVKAVALASAVTGGWSSATSEGAMATKIQSEKDEAARKIQAAFAKKKQRGEQQQQQQRAAANQRRSAVGRAFRAAARASLAFAGPAARLKATAAFRIDGKFEGAVMHAGHLHMMPQPMLKAGSGGGSSANLLAGLDVSDGLAPMASGFGIDANGKPAAAAALVPGGEYYCVLLASRVLLCFEIGSDGMVSGTFDPHTGEAQGVRPIELGSHAKVKVARGTYAAEGAEAKAAAAASKAANTGKGRAPPAALGFELVTPEGGVVRSWRSAPALYDERAKGAVAKAVRTWVRALSAALVPDNLRGSRASLARTTTMLQLAEEDDDDEDDEDEQDGEKQAKNAPREPAAMAGQWADGCYYRGDGSVAYYATPCHDDPYALVHAV